jgi:hypothetical protein
LEGQDDDSANAIARRRKLHQDWRRAAHEEAPLLMQPYGYSCKPPHCGNSAGPGVYRANPLCSLHKQPFMLATRVCTLGF